jgi:Ferritin-like
MMYLTHEIGALKGRDTCFIETDKRVVRWIAQAAINVELFTIPLYMTTLYSLTGMHPITGKGNDFYAGRQWPGAKASAFPRDVDRSQPGWANRECFNIIFSVFIQEMLHLQMAANLATAIGHQPCFTSTALQNEQHGWTCYGPKQTVIPNIVDLKDTRRFSDVTVSTGSLNKNQIRLFLAIELPQEEAEEEIRHNKHKYFPKVPFDHGKVGFDPATSGLMFGSIGYMYQCYKDYLLIEYADGSRLWDHVFNPNGLQNDLFNNFSFPGHPMREFMGFETTIALTDKGIALSQALDMMNAITDQGEGATLKARLNFLHRGHDHGEVQERYRSSKTALESDYPSYSDTGQQVPSADAEARYPNDKADHYARFQEILHLMEAGGTLTWDQSDKPGRWKAEDLISNPDLYKASLAQYGLPSAESIATAMNDLFAQNLDANHALLSQAAVGAIKGVTTVLDSYWTAGSGTGFPFPSMAGSGDRMSACWAVTGMGPDLSLGIENPNENILNHACQGLSLSGPDAGQATNNCAGVAIYHTCRGSNLCKGMGGCGFVQSVAGGGSCSSGGGGGCGASSTSSAALKAAPPLKAKKGGGCGAVRMRAQGGLCGGPSPGPGPSSVHYTAPSDNICASFGGCAVPISACQVYPQSGTMDVYQFVAPHGCGKVSEKIGTLAFHEGDKVEDVAFKAFEMVVQKLNPTGTLPKKPAPNALRLAFPPST